MSSYLLRLYQDILPADNAPVYLPMGARSIYVVDGNVTVELPDCGQHHAQGSAWVGQDAITLLTGPEGARLWRWELLARHASSSGELHAAPGTESSCKLSAEVELDNGFEWLMRIDRVGFPMGGIAFTHVHQGPGIRCCLNGEITIETEGQTNVFKPGEAWLERGRYPVYAPTTEECETEFIRCLILPRACKGRSSIRYVLAEDAAKPKRQRYHVFSERYIDLP
ncbi:hypothetical protein SAMN04515620_12650 [Collimonas sp. OK607]|uniref:hypothetical protein n=1 Tax=Collimonas sp. OK607 TaxID=1798194 RepID=UPI0008E9132D|nr:hypothetical protein [Collimonas sp. OK607]SFB21328.1 hypothetical protein SAMN04515620_12650 [Collimonas sp. OK607]